MKRALEIDAAISKVEDGINQVNTEGICEGYTRACLGIDLTCSPSRHTLTHTQMDGYLHKSHMLSKKPAVHSSFDVLEGSL